MHGLRHDINILFAISKGMVKVFERPKVERLIKFLKKTCALEKIQVQIYTQELRPCKSCTSRFHLNHLRKVLRQRLIWLKTTEVFMIKNCWLRLR